ncbi:uncharacterized protein DUF4836 [Bacteroides zoogleoformans]|uniref:DUF4836 domain-containing protein n=1 Tax=Bacteroides zoogleoformans TaxID=28119 RepID=A0ABM6T6T3_9BACE|nr:DUF4836 family protein [Bacteroides zoogleoformans]AVM52482.1 DUF4836 domain-containing protein [Bacteroides zoogleoformans]TWJ14243.1 uncharacterized protein DUF4836 [Bacteroides zoogleoformans]
MKKNLLFRLLPLLTLVFILCACSKTEKTEYTHAIPANATEVAAIDMKAIVEKAGLNTPANREMWQKLFSLLLDGSNPALFKQLEAIAEHPEEMGIDWNAPIFAFKAVSLHSMVATIKVDDLKKLEVLIKTLAEKNFCNAPVKADGYYTTNIGEAGIQLAFNDGTLLVVYGGSAARLKKLSAAVTALMKQPADKSIHANPFFAPMMKQKGDIRLLATPDTLPFDIRGVLNWPQGTQLYGYLLFENGRIYACLQRAGFNGETRESNQPFHPRNTRELQLAMAQMMQGVPFNIELTKEELLTVTNLRALMVFAADEPEVQTLYQLINKIDVLNARGDSNRTTFTVVLQDKKNNSLKQLADFGKQFIGL